MQTRYITTLGSHGSDNRLPDVHEFAAVVRAGLAALPEMHAVEIEVVREAENGETFETRLRGPYGH